MAFITAEDRLKFQAEIGRNLLFGNVCGVELPRLQTEDYIRLRSKLNIDAFPYTDQGELHPREDDSAKATSDSLTTLSYQMEAYKLNTLYHYKVDFGTEVKLESFALHFEKELLVAYKVLVRAIADDEIIY